MKYWGKIGFELFVLVLLTSFSSAQMKCAPGKCGSSMMQETKTPEEKHSIQCSVCGMKLQMFPKTSHQAKVNGKTKYYCSIHCIAADIHKGTKLKEIKVIDADTFQYIDASKAYYVITKGRRGTMTMHGKTAFSSKESADAFAQKFGGYITDFTGALKEAEKDFEEK